jgi:hypothetical protein
MSRRICWHWREACRDRPLGALSKGGRPLGLGLSTVVSILVTPTWTYHAWHVARYLSGWGWAIYAARMSQADSLVCLVDPFARRHNRWYFSIPECLSAVPTHYTGGSYVEKPLFESPVLGCAWNKQKICSVGTETNRNSISFVCFLFVSRSQKHFFSLFWCFGPVSKQSKQAKPFRNNKKRPKNIQPNHLQGAAQAVVDSHVQMQHKSSRGFWAQ